MKLTPRSASVYYIVQRLEVAGAEVQNLEVAGSLLPVGVPVTAEGSGSEYLQCQQCVQQPEGCQQRLHALMVAQSEGTGGVSAYGLESSEVVEPGWMRQHELDGHPYDKRCPWCVQGRLRQKQHFRQQPGSKKSPPHCLGRPSGVRGVDDGTTMGGDLPSTPAF